MGNTDKLTAAELADKITTNTQSLGQNGIFTSEQVGMILKIFGQPNGMIGDLDTAEVIVGIISEKSKTCDDLLKLSGLIQTATNIKKNNNTSQKDREIESEITWIGCNRDSRDQEPLFGNTYRK